MSHNPDDDLWKAADLPWIHGAVIQLKDRRKKNATGQVAEELSRGIPRAIFDPSAGWCRSRYRIRIKDETTRQNIDHGYDS
jgi:hypothetical protein